MVRSTKNLLERMTTLKRCSRPFNNECEVAGGPRPPTTFRELHDIERQRTQHRILSKILDCGSSPNKNEGEEKEQEPKNLYRTVCKNPSAHHNLATRQPPACCGSADPQHRRHRLPAPAAFLRATEGCAPKLWLLHESHHEHANSLRHHRAQQAFFGEESSKISQIHTNL